MRSSLSVLLFSIALLGCNSQTSSAITPTGNERQTEPIAAAGTITPTATHQETTPTPSLNLSATSTSIVPATSEMQGTTLLSGIITLESQDTIPLLTSLDLRNPENFNLIKQTETSQDGSYRLIDVPEGSYNLWIRVPSTLEVEEGCQDLSLPDNSWKWGVKFGDIRGVILDTVSRESAVKLAANIQSPIKSDEDLFAVWQEVSLSANIPQQLDLEVTCK